MSGGANALLAVLRGDREDRRRPDPRQGGHQRALEGVSRRGSVARKLTSRFAVV